MAEVVGDEGNGDAASDVDDEGYVGDEGLQVIIKMMHACVKGHAECEKYTVAERWGH